MDPYQPEPWHDFFLATASAAAALTGLVFVALSLHMEYIAKTQVYRDMARGSLIGLVMAVVLCLLVLVSQPVQWLSVELAFGGFTYLAVVGGQQLWSVWRAGRRVATESLVRSLASYLLALAGGATGIGQILRLGPGLYVTAVIVVTIMLWALWNSWVLLIGVADEELAQSPNP